MPPCKADSFFPNSLHTFCCCLFVGSHCVVVGPYSWLCTQALLLVSIGDHMGCSGSNPAWLCARQVPSLLNYLPSPSLKTPNLSQHQAPSRLDASVEGRTKQECDSSGGEFRSSSDPWGNLYWTQHEGRAKPAGSERTMGERRTGPHQPTPRGPFLLGFKPEKNSLPWAHWNVGVTRPPLTQQVTAQAPVGNIFLTVLTVRKTEIKEAPLTGREGCGYSPLSSQGFPTNNTNPHVCPQQHL